MPKTTFVTLTCALLGIAGFSSTTAAQSSEELTLAKAHAPTRSGTAVTRLRMHRDPAPAPGHPQTPALTSPPPEWFRFDLGAIFSLYTSAVERGTGGESNKQLAIDRSLGFHAAGSYRFWGPFSIGVYLQFETGQREMGEFTGEFDGDDRALVGPRVGGSFWEFWMGPFVRAQYRWVFAELGWGALGLRGDDGRTDLPNETGETGGAFRTTADIAWLLGLGASVPLVDRLSLLLRIQYRIRYYTTRGGEDLADEVAHGTQDILPFVGVAWRLDRP